MRLALAFALSSLVACSSSAVAEPSADAEPDAVADVADAEPDALAPDVAPEAAPADAAPDARPDASPDATDASDSAADAPEAEATPDAPTATSLVFPASSDTFSSSSRSLRVTPEAVSGKRVLAGTFTSASFDLRLTTAVYTSGCRYDLALTIVGELPSEQVYLGGLVVQAGSGLVSTASVTFAPATFSGQVTVKLQSLTPASALGPACPALYPALDVSTVALR
jgi:hypothetical protein